MRKIKPFYQIISCFFFAILGVQIKKLLLIDNIENLVFYRSFFGMLLLLITILLTQKRVFFLINTGNIKIHIFRCLCGVSAMYFGYQSLMFLTLAQASTIGFTKVFFTCLISFFIFAEKLNLKLIVLIFLGFLGIILITRPGQIESDTGVYMAIFSAICVSGGIISISYLSKREETLTILFYHSLFSTIIFFSIFYSKISFKSFDLIGSYFLITLTALLGQYFNTESYKNFETKNVVILSYSRIIFSTIFGFIFFDEKINFMSLVGILIVCLTSFLVQKK